MLRHWSIHAVQVCLHQTGAKATFECEMIPAILSETYLFQVHLEILQNQLLFITACLDRNLSNDTVFIIRLFSVRMMHCLNKPMDHTQLTVLTEGKGKWKEDSI